MADDTKVIAELREEVERLKPFEAWYTYAVRMEAERRQRVMGGNEQTAGK